MGWYWKCLIKHERSIDESAVYNVFCFKRLIPKFGQNSLFALKWPAIVTFRKEGQQMNVIIGSGAHRRIRVSIVRRRVTISTGILPSGISRITVDLLLHERTVTPACCCIVWIGLSGDNLLILSAVGCGVYQSHMINFHIMNVWNFLNSTDKGIKKEISSIKHYTWICCENKISFVSGQNFKVRSFMGRSCIENTYFSDPF